MRSWGFFTWLAVAGAVCLVAASVLSLVDGHWLSAALQVVGAACFVASAVLAGRRDRSSQHADQRST